MKIFYEMNTSLVAQSIHVLYTNKYLKYLNWDGLISKFYFAFYIETIEAFKSVSKTCNCKIIVVIYYYCLAYTELALQSFTTWIRTN